MSPKRQRLLFVLVSVVCISAAALLTLNALKEHIVFFFSPSDLAEKTDMPRSTIRVGGLVEDGSLIKQGDKVEFTVTDGKADLRIHYTGLLPALFREGQGVVAEGTLSEPGLFTATRVLAKHDETYMPPEVADALKKSGHWHGEEGKAP